MVIKKNYFLLSCFSLSRNNLLKNKQTNPHQNRNIKQIVACCCLCVVIGVVGYVFYFHQEDTINPYHDIIRLHVIANSDSVYDQSLKLEVRDKVVALLKNYLTPAQNKEEAYDIIQAKLPEIEKKCNFYIRGLVPYQAEAVLGQATFPIKSYGSLVLPEGNYDALRIVLGEGAGKNWWCVLFPPLCFVDASGEFTDNLQEAENLQSELTQDQDHIVSDSTKIEVRFKALELLK